jgi:hypothetical protein
MALTYDEDDRPLVYDENSATLPPPPEMPDTDPVPAAEDPVMTAVKAVHALVANIALKLESVDNKASAAISEARAARDAAVLAHDTSDAIAIMLREEVMASLDGLDEKIETIGMRLSGTVEALAGVVGGHAEVLHEHQRRLDDHDDAREPAHASNGNGAAE